jgi:hypothetical protein
VNVAGFLRVDLSGFVQHGFLLVTGDVVYAARVADTFRGRILLDIGDAIRVQLLDPRLVEMFANAESVTVIGSDPRGVTEAIAALRPTAVSSDGVA